MAKTQAAQIKELRASLKCANAEAKEYMDSMNDWQSRCWKAESALNDVRDKRDQLEEANAHLMAENGKLQGYKERVQELDRLEREDAIRQEQDMSWFEHGNSRDARGRLTGRR